jgi:predicted membrane protein
MRKELGDLMTVDTLQWRCNNKEQALEVFFHFKELHTVVLPAIVVVVNMLRDPVLFFFVVLVVAIILLGKTQQKATAMDVLASRVLVLFVFLVCRLYYTAFIIGWTWGVLVAVHCAVSVPPSHKNGPR